MEWRDIPNYKGYQVSNTGLVRTHNKITSSSLCPERHWKDRILKPKLRADGKRGGDARVDLWRDGKPHGYKISRLVAFTFYEHDIEDHTLTVNHIDGNWKNNSLDNLELISLADNIRHGHETGLYKNTCKPVTVINKHTQESYFFKSMSSAGAFMGKSKGYLNQCIRNGRNENADYRWIVNG